MADGAESSTQIVIYTKPFNKGSVVSGHFSFLGDLRQTFKILSK